MVCFRVIEFIKTSLSSSFPFVRGEVLPATVSPRHLIVFSTLLCLLSSYSGLPPLLPSSHLFITVLPSQPIGIPRLLLPCSRNSAALFGSLYVIRHPFYVPSPLYSAPRQSLCQAILSLPLTPPFSACLPSLLLLFFIPSCFRTHLHPLLL